MARRNKKRLQIVSPDDIAVAVGPKDVFEQYVKEYPDSKLKIRQFMFIVRNYFEQTKEEIFNGHGVKASHGRVYQIMRIKRRPRKRGPIDYAASAAYKRSIFGCDDLCGSYASTKGNVGLCKEISPERGGMNILRVTQCPLGKSDVVFKRNKYDEEGAHYVIRDTSLYKLAFVQRETNVRRLKNGKSYEFIPKLNLQQRVLAIADREQYEIK